MDILSSQLLLCVEYQTHNRRQKSYSMVSSAVRCTSQESRQSLPRISGAQKAYHLLPMLRHKRT